MDLNSPSDNKDYMIDEKLYFDLVSFPRQIMEIKEYMAGTRRRNKYIFAKYCNDDVDIHLYATKTALFNWSVNQISKMCSNSRGCYVGDLMKIPTFMYGVTIFFVYYPDQNRIYIMELRPKHRDKYTDIKDTRKQVLTINLADLFTYG